MKLKTKQKNEPVIDTTGLVFNRRMTLWERFVTVIREIFR